MKIHTKVDTILFWYIASSHFNFNTNGGFFSWKKKKMKGLNEYNVAMHKMRTTYYPQIYRLTISINWKIVECSRMDLDHNSKSHFLHIVQHSKLV